MADDPTAIFIFPIVRQTDKFIFAGDVGEKREAPAGDRAEIALAKTVSQALDRHLPFRNGRTYAGRLSRCIPLPEMPQICIGLQVIPLSLVGCGDSVPCVAAKWHAAHVIGGAFCAAIKGGDGCMER